LVTKKSKKHKINEPNLQTDAHGAKLIEIGKIIVKILVNAPFSKAIP